MRVDRRAGYAAWIWVIAFIAAHIYWFAGGRIGHPNALPPLSFSLFAVIVAGMFLVGAVVPLESVHEWGRVIPRPMLLTLLWAGSVVLLLRGAAGMVDEALRMTGISPNGLTGLTRAQVTGSANPSTGVLWSGRPSTPTSSSAVCCSAWLPAATRGAPLPPDAVRRTQPDSPIFAVRSFIPHLIPPA